MTRIFMKIYGYATIGMSFLLSMVTFVEFVGFDGTYENLRESLIFFGISLLVMHFAHKKENTNEAVTK